VLRNGRLVTQISRDDLQRTVRRYTVAVTDGWQAPVDVKIADLRRSRAGREVQCTLVGEEEDVTARLALTGAEVRDVTSLTLEEAALVFLTEEGS
jgi:ABC-2 type transport system ATP-binding protein